MKNYARTTQGLTRYEAQKTSISTNTMYDNDAYAMASDVQLDNLLYLL